MKLKIDRSGVYLDDVQIKSCTRVDIENINPAGPAEVTLHIKVDEVDVDYQMPRY